MADDEAVLLRTLHDEHAAPLLRYVIHLTGDPGLAEDIVQETLIRAWRKCADLDQSGTRAWLTTVARHLAIDASRRASHRHEVGTDTVPDHGIADRSDTVLDAWLIADSLASLSHDHRAVIVHAYYGGESTAEIAEELEIPPGTVKSRLHYGLRALRLALQERGVTR